MAYVFCILGAVIYSIYRIGGKKIINDNKLWSKRPALLAATVMFVGGISSLTASLFLGGPKIVENLSWYKTFVFAVFVTGILNIWIQDANMRAQSRRANGTPGLDASIVSAISASTPIFILAPCIWYLDEKPSWTGVLGIFLLAFGTYFLCVIEYLRKKGKTSIWDIALRDMVAPFLDFFRDEKVRVCYFGVALSTISLIFDGFTARAANVSFASGVLFTMTSVGLMILAYRRNEFTANPINAESGKPYETPDSPDWWSKLWTTNVLKLMVFWTAWPFALSIYFHGLSYNQAIIPYVATLKRLQIPMTMVLAHWLLPEEKEKKKFRYRFVAGVILTVGAILLAPVMSKWTGVLK